MSLAATHPADILFVGLVENGVGPAAVWLLRAFGDAADLVGNTIGDPAGMVSVAVTRACDGHGLMAVLLGILLGWATRTTPLARLAAAFVGGIVVIVAFNTLRIAALFVFRGGDAGIYEITHEVIFAVASVWIVGMLAALAENAGPRHDPFVTPGEMLRFALVLALVTIGWIYAAGFIVEHAFAPALDLALATLGPTGIGAVGFDTGHSVIDTLLVAARNPLGLLSEPFEPAAFLLPLPIALAAALAAARRPARGAAMIALVVAVGLLTAALGAVSAVSHEAARLGVREMAEMVGPREVRLVPSRFPGEATAIWLDRVRNVLVHLNLFVLPLMIFPLARRPRHRFAGYAPAMPLRPLARQPVPRRP